MNNGIYHVTISANSSNGDDHGSATFEWDVTDTNRLAWMDDQVSPYYVTGIVHAVDAFNHPITYGAVGLPTGFTINPQTGSLTGGTPEAQITMFSVTLSATDGTYTDYRSFRWTILGGNTPAIFLGLNDTYNSSDDLVVLNSPSTYHIRVFLYDPAASVPVSVEIKALDNNGVQSDKVSLGGNVLQMRGGDSAEVLVVPIKESGAENDVHFVAFLNHVAIKDVPDSVISLHVSPVVPLPPAPPDPTDHIRAPNTPTGMADRIPPRTPTPYIVWYTMGTNGNKITDMDRYFWIRVPKRDPNANTGPGQSTPNGWVEIADSKGVIQDWLRYNPAANPNGYNGTIRGGEYTDANKKVNVYQTQPGNAGKLFFTLFDAGAQDDNGKKEYESKGFSVAAIPIAVQMKLMQATKNMPTLPLFSGQQTFQYNPNAYIVRYGAAYTITWKSDSDNPDDLSEILAKETVTVSSATGFFKGDPAPKQQETFANIANLITDLHSHAESWKRQAPTNTFANAQVATWLSIHDRYKLKGAGTETLQQNFYFLDRRTGYTDEKKPLVVLYSGFEIDIDVTGNLETAKFSVLVTKKPTNVGSAQNGLMDMPDMAQKEDKVKGL